MTLDINWGDEQKQYAYVRFHPKWTWADNVEARKLYIDMMQSVPHRVDVIADFTGVSTLPTNMFANVKRIANDRLANEGYFILVGAGSFVRSIVSILIRIVPAIEKQYAVADSMEDALEIVTRGRSDEELVLK